MPLLRREGKVIYLRSAVPKRRAPKLALSLCTSGRADASFLRLLSPPARRRRRRAAPAAHARRRYEQDSGGRCERTELSQGPPKHAGACLQTEVKARRRRF